MGESFSDNREKIRAEIYKYAGFVLCSPAAIMTFEFIAYESIVEGQFLEYRIAGAIALLVLGLGFLVNSLDIMYNIDRREYFARFYKQQS